MVEDDVESYLGHVASMLRCFARVGISVLCRRAYLREDGGTHRSLFAVLESWLSGGGAGEMLVESQDGLLHELVV